MSTQQTHPYTCLACALAFTTAQTQRTHYSTDLHRYNSKRAVAGLSPIDADTFNLKFNQTNLPTTQETQHNSWKCLPCHKSFNTPNAHQNHLTSKKHLAQIIHDTQAQKLKKPTSAAPATLQPTPESIKQLDDIPIAAPAPSEPKPPTDSLLDRMVQLRIDQAPEIDPLDCLFCPGPKKQFQDLDQVLKHMLSEHGFFLPDQDFLVDKIGLLKYLAQTIAVWNVCIYCGTGFGGKIESDQDLDHLASATKNGLNSVRKHMCDKNHCKIAWDTEQDRLEYSDFFDYRSSYKHGNAKKSKVKAILAARISKTIGEDEDEDSEWEDEDIAMKTDDESIGEDDGRASFGDSLFELVLPNGVRIGHRSLRHIYKQNLLPYSVGSQSTAAGNRNINLITRMAILSNQSSSALANVNHQSVLLNHLGRSKASSLAKSSLIPAQGAGINFNAPHSAHHQVIKANDPGQARFAGHHIRTFKDTNRRLQFQNRVSCKSGNNQTHYRDPLLQ